MGKRLVGWGWKVGTLELKSWQVGGPPPLDPKIYRNPAPNPTHPHADLPKTIFAAGRQNGEGGGL